MTLYSSDPRIGRIGGPTTGKWVPFTAFARIVPAVYSGRRREWWHDMEKKAQAIETAILTDVNLRVAVPVAFTPNFRRAPSRVTITGFYLDSSSPVAPPVTPTHSLIHSGTVEGEKTSVLHSVQGIQTYGDNPTTQNMNQTKAIRAALVADCLAAGITLDVFYMDVEGVKYGQLPPKKGFFTFPT